MEFFNLREEVEDASNAEEVSSLKKKLERMEEQAVVKLETLFSDGNLGAATELLAKLQFIRKV
jgi:hypothetical protein